jgi:hypothetical protein
MIMAMVVVIMIILHREGVRIALALQGGNTGNHGH